ncbi:hypothetical protein DM02DRAFT_659155 [Periconia macrospinosa]|uniref:Cell wall protein n=1 Tax=Periconia macrospinosa TaxID=97972 RepID=A0A2V1DH77_9PLEO|nr:hypothetical protein DM02DRAFT_659155 [Periconia macrospinosa]
MPSLSQICMLALTAGATLITATPTPKPNTLTIPKIDIDIPSLTSAVADVKNISKPAFKEALAKLPKLSRRTELTTMDEYILTSNGMNPLATALSAGAKQLASDLLDQNNKLHNMVTYATTDTDAENAALETRLRALILSIPSTTPLDRIRKQVATITRTIISGLPARDVNVDIDILIPIFASGGAIPDDWWET